MASDEFRLFMREIATRHERIWREQRDEARTHRAELREMRIEMRDLREESRAQTRALLHVLGRLENGGAQA